MSKISVVINTLNAERVLAKCLESVQQAYEIIICDMHSDDTTVEIAKQFGCKIFYHERTGIVEPARNWAMDQTTGDWILILDADEVVTAQLWEFLVEYAENPKPDHFACNVTRETAVLGKILPSWRQSKCKRFWKKGVCTFSTSIHSTPPTKYGKDFSIKGKNLYIVHYHLPSISSFNEKIDRYTDFEIERFVAKNQKFSFIKMMTKTYFEFFRYYILKGAIFEGLHGFLFAKLKAHYKFVQWAKLYEREFKNKNTDLIY
ncbi:MAG: glycosyltransferase family 2 protein [Cyclobacteriaceae bacterium]|nr:glycosyltransferase family 2 protein [Cyclobacteriaceae bacterium]